MTIAMRRLALVLSALVPLSSGCSDEGDGGGGGGDKGGGKKGRGARPFPVEVQPVGARDVAYVISAVGTVEAFEEIQVTSRVTGVVEKILFAEGQSVRASQPLAEIEPRRFQLAVDANRAALAKARAAMAEAEAGLARREKATRDNPGLVPGEELETWRTRVATAGAEVQSAQVAVERAALDRREAFVRAPVAGVLQSRTVRTGQFVQPGTVLATLIQRDPLLLRFDVPARESGGLRPGMPVEFAGPAGEEPYRATIKLVTTAADPNTRMVKVTAEVEDPRKDTLQAGSFARVAVQMGTSSGAVVIPQTAVRPSEKGFLTYVVNGTRAAERVVDIGMHTADGMVEVKRGLRSGEQLVVRGAEALREGAQVVITGEVPPGKPVPLEPGKSTPKPPAQQAPAQQAPAQQATEAPAGGGAQGRTKSP